jgi:hypothetical protein
MVRASTQPVRLPGDLIEALRGEATVADRSLPAETEARLRDSLDRGAWAAVEPQLMPRSRAIGRLLGFLANELMAYSPAGEENDYLRHGVARMLDRLSGKTVPGPEHDAATMADYWWLRLNNADERIFEQGSPVPMTNEQRALAEIRSDLGIGQSEAAERPQKKWERG